MPTETAYEDPPASFWPRVREFAVPPSMIETATARRRAGDWAGACAAAGFDVDLNPRLLAHTHGRELATRVRDDLRALAPDLLRWHMPRTAPHGLLRPGLTVALARYEGAGRAGAEHPAHLVVRTAPAWADAGQRIDLGLWDGARDDPGARRHPHPHPDRRFRLDLHRHLWDARRAGELRIRSAGRAREGEGERHAAVDRWADEAGILLRAEGRTAGRVVVRLGARDLLLLDVVPRRAAAGAAGGDGPPAWRIVGSAPVSAADPALPVLPDAATWEPPDLALLRTGAIDPGRLHPLVARALVPDHPPTAPSPRPPDPAGAPHRVSCRGAEHRIALVDGVLAALDHDPAELRREELLVALTGTPLPCLQAIDTAHRRPDCITGVRERLRHGDVAGALAVVEGLLGTEAVLRDGALRDELEAAARQRVVHGLFRAGLTGPAPGNGVFLPYGASPRPRRTSPRRA
ncbi:hypothetical protein AB0P15_16395 [Streptomyces sp. NPDC087917]|uniref:hypothetical protein n=1 Tax=Streptomyces sp. NPDC087917 TaxID=3155060 RepID=UPI00341F1326